MTGYNAHIIARPGQAGLRQTNCNEEIINSDNCLLSSDLTNEKHSQSSTVNTTANNQTEHRERGERSHLPGVDQGGREENNRVL